MFKCKSHLQNQPLVAGTGYHDQGGQLTPSSSLSRASIVWAWLQRWAWSGISTQLRLSRYTGWSAGRQVRTAERVEEGGRGEGEGRKRESGGGYLLVCVCVCVCVNTYKKSLCILVVLNTYKKSHCILAVC